MLGVRLPKALDKRLSDLARCTKRPKSFYVKDALTEYLDIHESTYKVIAQYEEDKRNGTLETITLEELKKKYGLMDEDLAAEVF